jgi:ribosomal protein S8
MFIVSQSLGLINIAYKERRRIVKIRRTKFVLKILQLFYEEGLIRGYSLTNDLKSIFIFLKYYEKEPMIRGFKIFSNSRKKVYVSSNFLFKYILSKGLFILTTSKYGLIFSTRLSRKNIDMEKKIGGKLLFKLNV